MIEPMSFEVDACVLAPLSRNPPGSQRRGSEREGRRQSCRIKIDSEKSEETKRLQMQLREKLYTGKQTEGGRREHYAEMACCRVVANRDGAFREVDRESIVGGGKPGNEGGVHGAGSSSRPQ